MSPPKKLRKTDEEKMKRTPDGLIRFEADKVTALVDGGDGRFSPKIEVGGVLWSVAIRLYEEYLEFVLMCDHEQLTNWIMDVNTVCILFNSDNSKNYKIEKSRNIDNKYSFCQVLRVKWTKLIDAKGFIIDDKITIEVRFWISNIKGIKYLPRFDFTDPNDPRHDITLVIEGEKIYASKQILAANSSFFNSLFYGQFAEKDKKEIELKDVDREEFLEMLQVIYPSCKKITDESAEYLLELGDRFQIANLMDRAEKYLLETRDISNTEKLAIADEYGLFELMEHCLSNLKTKEDFKDAEDIFDDLSDGTKKTLFSKLLIIDK